MLFKFSKKAFLIVFSTIFLIIFLSFLASYDFETSYFSFPWEKSSDVAGVSSDISSAEEKKELLSRFSEDITLDDKTDVFVLKRDLNGDGGNENIYLVSYPYEESIAEGETLVLYVQGLWKETSFLKLDNRLHGAFIHDFGKDGREELFVKTIGGKTIYTYPLKLDSDRLVRIPIIESDGRSFEYFSTTSSLEAKDWDGDGKDEVLVYYRFYPPEKRRTVVVYKFDGEKFVFFKEYEEGTEEVFL